MRQSALRDKLLHGSGKRFVALAMTLGALTVNAATHDTTSATRKEINVSQTNDFANDQYFLSPANPLANVDQRYAETTAIQLMQTPAVREARATVAKYWKGIIWQKLTTPRAVETFENFIDEFVFNYAIRAAAGDPNYPRVLRVDQLRHEWFGMKVPGSRNDGNSPDTIYTMVPVDPTATYAITGKIREPRPIDQTFNIMGDMVPRMTIEAKKLKELHIEPDGSFTIIVGPKKPEGANNFFKTDMDTRYFYARDSMGDWAREVPMELRVKRLTPPSAPPQSFDEMAARTARWAIYDVASMSFYASVFSRLPENQMTQPDRTPGGLVSQLTSFGNLKLADDEAIVVTISTGGAAYHSIMLHDFTMCILDSYEGIVSLNHAQTALNADGSATYVISKQDPGIYNWLNTLGWNEVYVVNRWQGFPPGISQPTPTVSTKVVKLNELASVLPPETRRVSAKEREEQVAKHLRELLARYVDH